MSKPAAQENAGPSERVREFLVQKRREPDLDFEDWLSDQPAPLEGLRRTYAEWQLVRQFGELGLELLGPPPGEAFAPPNHNHDPSESHEA